MGGRTRLRNTLRRFLRIEDPPAPEALRAVAMEAARSAVAEAAAPAAPEAGPDANEFALLTGNVRQLASALTRHALDTLPVPDAPPAHRFDTSRPLRAADFESDAFLYWCQRTGERPRYHRKLWELAYILQIAHQEGILKPGMRALGFGCGREPIPAVLAAAGVEVVATDLPADRPEVQAWTPQGQHADSLDALRRPAICPDDLFSRQVSFRAVDMTAIPEDLAGGFDFCWSTCALEHIGGLKQGLDFLVNQLACLKPGGLFVHTTEYNVTSNGETVESPLLSVYRRRDLEAVAGRMAAAGARLLPFDFDAAESLYDSYVDLPPYPQPQDLHLRIALGRYVISTFGIAGRLAGDRPTG